MIPKNSYLEVWSPGVAFTSDYGISMYSFFVQFVISYKLLSFSKYLKTFNVEIVVQQEKWVKWSNQYKCFSRFQDEPIQKRWKINKLAKLEDAVAEKAKQKLENPRPSAASDYVFLFHPIYLT